MKTIRKVLLVATLSLTMGITGCSSKENNNPNDGDGTTEVEPKRELTSLEKEISELQEFQTTDKIYDNKDLEPFNLMQGYLYRKIKGKDETEVVELTGPDNEEALQELQSNGYTYVFIDNVIIPIYFSYDENEGKWYKMYYKHMNSKDITYPIRMDDKYRYISDEELTELFGTDDPFIEKQFNLKN